MTGRKKLDRVLRPSFLWRQFYDFYIN